MSCDYNARLKHHAHKVTPAVSLIPSTSALLPLTRSCLQGPVGLEEERHPPQLVADAAADVAKILRKRECWSAEQRQRQPVVVLTGAGISTSAGIPDFRGPGGVWTAEACGAAAPQGTSLDFAQPTFSHMALVALQVLMLADAVLAVLMLRAGSRPDR
jgi:hypothetical protein